VLAGPNGAGKSAMAVELLVEVQTALLARARAECAAFVTPGDGSEALRAGLEQGALASLYLIVRGAADGALLGAATGGGVADGAWIGAAVGAGLGLVVGLVAGVGKSLEEQRRHRAAYEACVAGRVGSTFASLREAARARRSAFSKPMACLCDARVNWAQAPGLARRRLVSTVRRIDGESGRRLACLCENARGPIP